MDRTATNVTGETLSNRNPRFELKPGQSILLDMETISHAVRNWIRSGALELSEKVETAKAPTKTAPGAAKATPAKAKQKPIAPRKATAKK